ncbi:MAG: hypothetical protein KC478_01260 [Bacteriovoracaceae bacterium]|nr:hypothetical protein [Bacteriovoracaceae bacterium]
MSMLKSRDLQNLNPKKMNKLILVPLFLYFLFCSVMHDPKVAVDDSPNKPFFNELILSVSATAINAMQATGLHKRRVQEHFTSWINSNSTATNSSPVLLYFTLIALMGFHAFKFQLLSKSLLIRAPSKIS